MKMIYVVVAFALVAAFIAIVFLQSTPPQKADGVITSIEGIGGGTYQQSQAGAGRGFQASNPINVAPSYSIHVKIDGTDDLAHYSTDPQSVKQFSEGQPVRMEYIKRGMEPIWTKIFVTELEPK